MRKRKLGFTDLHLTTVGLGTWAIGGPWQFGWGHQDDDQAVSAILRALELGINWVDTAPIYGLGHSEELVAEALKQTSVRPFIATKCGLLWNERREKVNCLKPESIRRECHDSIRRLGVGVIDLYQMHWPVPDEEIERAWCEMAGLVKAGIVRYIGVSNCSLSQIKRLQGIYPVASLQPPYSMIHSEVEEELLGFCAANGIGVIAYSPMQRGLLTGKFSRESLAALPDDDHRKTNPDFKQPQFDAALELVESLRPIAARNGITPAQLAISWVLRRSEVAAAIVGARRPEQIEECSISSDIDLNDGDLREIGLLLKKRQKTLERSV